MHKIKHIIKNTIAHVLYYFGLLDIIKSIKLKNKLVVLMYHRVLTNSEAERSFSNSGIVVSDDSFKTHIQYLKNNFNLLNLDDVVDHVESRTQFDNLSCLITFDDGWKD
ncbi:MAG: hypothetical protein KAU29_01215, partial [Gammaproteobacteria bacterium]|nr:hypothetical protein [Gammaproteobacteria bacterium]